MRINEADERVQCEANIDLTIEQDLQCMEFNKATAACACEFDGETCNFYACSATCSRSIATERRRAFLKWASSTSRSRPSSTHSSTGSPSCASRWPSAPALTATRHGLRDASPAWTTAPTTCARSASRSSSTSCRCARGCSRSRLSGWAWTSCAITDESLIYPEGNAVPQGDMPELVKKAQAMYHELSPETGEFFDFMVEHELFDLVTRPGKHMGGYCTSLPDYKAPFIFSNFNGTSADVEVLTHEAGHAFEIYTTMRCQPIAQYYGSTSEINEIHSMAMECFTYPWMGKFFGDAVERFHRAHVMGSLEVVPYMCCVDEFQHRVYAENLDAAGRRRVWHELEQAYMPWRDYDGNEFLEGGGFWMQKQHIFLYPFYYIDYALAQVCVFELYGRMRQDRAAAWQDYLRLCRAGGSRGYFELLELATCTIPSSPAPLNWPLKPSTDALDSGRF